MFGITKKNGLDSLAPPIQDWITSQGWKKLHPIQERAIEVILGTQDDIIISAPTAGGKTEAAYLPLLSEINTSAELAGLSFDILYISPLKALINDQQERLESLCRKINVEITPWHGDIDWEERRSALRIPSGIIMITPESLEGFLIRRGSQTPEFFGNLNSVVIDELHEFIEDERGMQLQSLLSRIEISISRKIRRIGLSATLGDLELARRYLRPDNYLNVQVIEADNSQSKIDIHVLGYYENDLVQNPPEDRISNHLFENLRGDNNLIFAGTRNRVEKYSDMLREKSSVRSVENEFFPHHSYLSKDHRKTIELRLKETDLPTTAICTSTLELGLDIGDISSVAQIGAPYSASSMRQRLGRSGRRSKPSKLWQYSIESKLDSRTPLPDRLRLRLLRTLSIIELLLGGWNEPPKSGNLHLSTFVHQILSVIQEKGGIGAKRLYDILCKKGMFGLVSSELYVKVLNQLASPEVRLIARQSDGSISLDDNGLRLVDSYHFYAVFETPKVFKVMLAEREIGVLPLERVLTVGTDIILQGKRWRVEKIDEKVTTMWVEKSRFGNPVSFGGDPMNVHDRVVLEMYRLYSSSKVPDYLDTVAQDMLQEARDEFRNYSLNRKRILNIGDRSAYIATWAGSIKTWTLGVVFGSRGFNWRSYDGILEVHKSKNSMGEIIDVLEKLKENYVEEFLRKIETLRFEKFHPYLNHDLLLIDALSSKLDMESLPKLASDILDDKR